MIILFWTHRYLKSESFVEISPPPLSLRILWIRLGMDFCGNINQKLHSHSSFHFASRHMTWLSGTNLKENIGLSEPWPWPLTLDASHWHHLLINLFLFWRLTQVVPKYNTMKKKNSYTGSYNVIKVFLLIIICLCKYLYSYLCTKKYELTNSLFRNFLAIFCFKKKKIKISTTKVSHGTWKYIWTMVMGS